MVVWERGITDYITVIVDGDADLAASYVRVGEVDYIDISGTFTRQDDSYFLPHSFETTGIYIVRVVDINGNMNTLYKKVKVEEKVEDRVWSFPDRSVTGLTATIEQSGLTQYEHDKLFSLTNYDISTQEGDIHTALDTYPNKDGYSVAVQDIVDAVVSSPEITQLSESTETILDYQGGNWSIENNQMVFFKRDGSVLTKFNLLNKAGVPSELAVFKREATV